MAPKQHSGIAKIGPEQRRKSDRSQNAADRECVEREPDAPTFRVDDPTREAQPQDPKRGTNTVQRGPPHDQPHALIGDDRLTLLNNRSSSVWRMRGGFWRDAHANGDGGDGWTRLARRPAHRPGTIDRACSAGMRRSTSRRGSHHCKCEKRPECMPLDRQESPDLRLMRGLPTSRSTRAAPPKTRGENRRSGAQGS